MEFSNAQPTRADLVQMRRDYNEVSLDESQIDASGHPMPLFQNWLKEAIDAKVTEPNAMCLSTVTSEGRPASRYVLCKKADNDGFVWFTNYDSRKGEELAKNPFAALVFWWGDMERSVRIEGKVEKISTEESDAYFTRRPRDAEIGAWASHQSRPIGSQEELRK